MKRVNVLNLELGFTDKDKTLRMLNALSLDPRVAVNIMKARITEHAAWLKLELRGEAPRLLEVAAQLHEAAAMKDPSWRPVSRAS